MRVKNADPSAVRLPLDPCVRRGVPIRDVEIRPVAKRQSVSLFRSRDLGTKLGSVHPELLRIVRRLRPPPCELAQLLIPAARCRLVDIAWNAKIGIGSTLCLLDGCGYSVGSHPPPLSPMRASRPAHWLPQGSETLWLRRAALSSDRSTTPRCYTGEFEESAVGSACHYLELDATDCNAVNFGRVPVASMGSAASRSIRGTGRRRDAAQGRQVQLCGLDMERSVCVFERAEALSLSSPAGRGRTLLSGAYEPICCSFDRGSATRTATKQPLCALEQSGREDLKHSPPLRLYRLVTRDPAYRLKRGIPWSPPTSVEAGKTVTVLSPRRVAAGRAGDGRRRRTRKHCAAYPRSGMASAAARSRARCPGANLR
jgi:hypothetical protein